MYGGGCGRKGGAFISHTRRGVWKSGPQPKITQNLPLYSAAAQPAAAAAADGGDSSDGEQKGRSDTEETIRILEASVTQHLARSAGRRSDKFIYWNTADMRMTRREWR